MSAITHPNSSRSVQWLQVRKHVLEDGIGHPAEVPRIEIHLEGQEIRVI